jgi:hypothetical protein
MPALADVSKIFGTSPVITARATSRIALGTDPASLLPDSGAAVKSATMQDDAIAATAAPNVIGEARNYDELLDLLKLRRDQLDVSLEVVDAVAGLAQRYAAKLMSPTKIRTLGSVSMGLVLGALGLKLLVAIDQEQYERVRDRLTLRNVRPGRRQHLAVTRAAKAVAANPGKSDRAIAAQLGVGATTVRRARRATAPCGAVDKRIGRDAKVRRLPVRQPIGSEIRR